MDARLERAADALIVRSDPKRTGTEHRSDPSVLGVFFLLTEETEIQAKYEQNEVNDGALAADVGCLNRNGPCVRQHNGK
jgi:hypothetical protein